jgi:hypothetical protein
MDGWMDGWIQDLLRHVEEEKAMAPLPVVQVLQRGEAIKLSAVKDYLVWC